MPLGRQDWQGPPLQVPSIAVFRKHFASTARASGDGGGSTGLDAAGVLSAACYDEWLATRGSKMSTKCPERVFQRCILRARFFELTANQRARTITAHVTAMDGRRPFTSAEEAALLRELRVRRVWWVSIVQMRGDACS